MLPSKKMIGNNDLSYKWIKEEYYKQKDLKEKLGNAYNSCKDLTTAYAQGIWRVYKMRCEIIDIIAKYARNEDN